MAELASLVQRLEVAVKRLEAMPGAAMTGAGDSAGGATCVFVEAFEEIVKGPVAEYIRLSRQIGDDVQKHAELMEKVFAAHRDLLMKAAKFQKPSDDCMKSVVEPLSAAIKEVQAFREENRRSKYFNHLSAVSESMPACGWVTVVPKPGPHVKEMMDAGMFYSNRVLKDYKEKDKTHVDWVKAYTAIWVELQKYIKDHHTTGLTWSKTGPVASPSAGPPRAPAGGCPPPPPPGPPPPPVDQCESAGGGGDSGADSRNALFAAINQGSNITKGLKHVNDNQKTHKNPALRGQGAPVRTGPKPFAASTPRPAASAAQTPRHPPMLELDGKKWRVEYQEGAENLVISQTELKHVVYVYKCNKSSLQIKGKINAITIDGCKNMCLVFDDVVGTVDIINCSGAKIQVLGKVPIISINKTDGCHVYLSKDSMNCEVISAKSSEMNVSIPKADGEFEEVPVPEQYKTVWDGKKFVTTPSEIAG